jgi:hypothetical protein
MNVRNVRMTYIVKWREYYDERVIDSIDFFRVVFL